MKKELTPSGILRTLTKCWWICTLVALIFATGAFFFSRYNYSERYTSTTRFMIRYVDDDQSTSASNAVQGATYAQKMLNTYVAILNYSNDFDSELQAMYFAEYGEKMPSGREIRYTAATDTQLVNVYVTAYDKEDAYRICQAFVQFAPEFIDHLTGKPGELVIVDEATKPTTPSNSDNCARNTIIAALLGFLVPFAVNVVVDLFDVRILTAEDLRNTYNYPVLGEIPDFERYIGRKQGRKGGYGYGYGYSRYGYGYNYGYGGYHQRKSSKKQKGGN